VEVLADATVEAELAKIRIGYAVIETLHLVEKFTHRQRSKLQLLASQTREEFRDFHHHVELESAIRIAMLEKNVPLRDPLGATMDDIVRIGEKFASSPGFLAPIIQGMWSAVDGTPSHAIL
jgi:hypothetical protein